MRRFLFNITKTSTYRSYKRLVKPLVRGIKQYVPKYQFCWLNDLIKSMKDFPRIETNLIHNSKQYLMYTMINSQSENISYCLVSENDIILINPRNQLFLGPQCFSILESSWIPKYVLLTHISQQFMTAINAIQDIDCEEEIKLLAGRKHSTSQFQFDAINNGETIKFQNIQVQAISTPSYRSQQMSYIIKLNGKIQHIFVGDDLLFSTIRQYNINGASLAQVIKFTKTLYKSINKIKSLPLNTIIHSTYPLSYNKSDNTPVYNTTIQNLLKQNPFFVNRTQAQFIQYFLKKMSSSEGSQNIQQTFNKVFKKLTVQEFQKEIQNPNTIILDVRLENKQFFNGIIKGAYFVGNGAPLANYAKALFDINANFVIFGNKGQQQEAIRRLLQLGFNNIKGFNDFTLEQWTGDKQTHAQATINDLKQTSQQKNPYTILDLRTVPQLQKQGIFSGDNINIPIQQLQKAISQNKLPKQKTYLLQCRSGYRTKVASAILQPEFSFKVLAGSFAQYKDGGVQVIPKP